MRARRAAASNPRRLRVAAVSAATSGSITGAIGYPLLRLVLPLLETFAPLGADVVHDYANNVRLKRDPAGNRKALTHL